MGTRKAITRKHGFDGLCKGLMSAELYVRFEESLKKWRGLDCNDANWESNKKRALKELLDIFLEATEDDIRAGHLSKFRNLSSGFDKRLTNRQDKLVYHDLILKAPLLEGYLKKLSDQRKAPR